MIQIIFLLLFLVFPARVFAEEEILIGLIPEENIFTQMDRHRPLAAYLTKKLGTRVRFTILSRYGDVLDRFMSRKMDGAFFGVFTSVLAMEQLNAEPIVHPVNLDGSSAVQSYIFVRKDSNIQGVQDMKGKRIAFVDKATVTGYLYTLSFLRERGVQDPKVFFSDISFTGSHGSTIYAVLDGRADIGTAKSKIFHQLAKKEFSIKEELTILAKSREFPDSTLFLRKDLPPAIRLQIRDILLSMDKDAEGREVLKKLESMMFVEAKKSDFQPFFEIAQKAGIVVKTYKYK
ncbi:MAG: phosphate/phosphite/phosphonate ABC transporter substrate-binding protein [Nitrospirae bacterium]|nr:phosphate/phosphite/phosphonate ABC transporter substrate-binding protein [Nitrospirota bacterium]